MTEAFDNKSPRTTEFLDVSQRIKILAHAIVDITGVDHPKHPDTVQDSSWVDRRTNTTLKLQRKFGQDITHFFLDQFDTDMYQLGMPASKQYHFHSFDHYEVRRRFDDTEHDTPTIAEEASDPAEEVFDFLAHGPLENSAAILDHHEKIEVNERMREIIGTYAISDEAIIGKINKAHRIFNKNRQSEAMAKIISKLTDQYKADGLSDDDARRAIKRYRFSGHLSAKIRRPKKP